MEMQKKLKRTGLSLACVLGMSLGIVACSDDADDSAKGTAPEGSESAAESPSGEAGDSAAAFPVNVTTVDGEGNPKEFTLEKEPKRIVSASASLTGPLLAIDAPVVATGGGARKSPSYTDEEGFAVQWADAAREKGIEDSLYETEPQLEKILAADPDLVVMSSNGGDDATELYDEIADLVPVIVVDYSTDSWQDVTLDLGRNLGREDKAKQVVADFEKKVEDAAGKITVPEQPTDVVLQGPKGMFFFTPDSAQGDLMKELGFTVAKLPEGVVPADAMKKRGDAVPVNPENLPLALQGQSVFTLTINPAGDTMQALKENPELADAPAVKEDRLYSVPASFFRMDYYSANEFVDWAVETFG